MAGFQQQMALLTDTLGMADDPIVRDPAGFDDVRSVGGGNRLSARDLAIAARAFLADPELAAMAPTPRPDWIGGDGKPHFVLNQNRLLEAYPGAIGLKTGATDAAGSTFVAAAERDGRTLVAVVIRTDAKYAEAAALLDAGFLLASVDEVTDDVLPAVPADLAGVPTTTEAPTTEAPSTDAPTTEAAATTPSSAGPAGDQEVAAAPPISPTGSGDDGWPVPPSWMAGGGAVVLAGGGLAALAVRRSSRPPTIDRRPARPRLRDRRRGRTGRGLPT
jgi:D-alanyl-D-alanine carboxypeptidase (penicillin-binding protein 5/6)